MNPNYKIIKYTFDWMEKQSTENIEYDTPQTDFYMLVSYQILGENQDKACISMMEIDIETFTINPVNFVVISQKINKNANKYSSFSSMNSHPD